MRKVKVEEESTRNVRSERWTRSVGIRIFMWTVSLFLVTLVIFVALDVRHEWHFARSLGSSEEMLLPFLLNTLRLHAVHGAVTTLFFAIGILVIVRRLVTRRIRDIVAAIGRFRLGIWNARIPPAYGDEIEWLSDSFRQLGPYLERQFLTFVEVDRKTIAARLGKRYEMLLAPTAREILRLSSSELNRSNDDPGWRQIQKNAADILGQLKLLGKPEETEALLADLAPAFAEEEGNRPAGEGGDLPAPDGPSEWLEGERRFR